VDLVRAKADADLNEDVDPDFAAVLIRPDGAVCWRGETPLTDALCATFGAPTAASRR
jgi:hypothetical protein